ncbi:MAG: hypothetical protein ABI995_11510 [Acidobacteriota bacterium]
MRLRRNRVRIGRLGKIGRRANHVRKGSLVLKGNRVGIVRRGLRRLRASVVRDRREALEIGVRVPVGIVLVEAIVVRVREAIGADVRVDSRVAGRLSRWRTSILRS